MKKTIAVMAALCLLLFTAALADETPVRVMALKGPTAMGMVKMMEEPGARTFDIVGAIDEVTPALIQGRTDIAAIPANLSSALYNNTEGAVQVLAINTLGVLYIVDTDDSVHSVSDLRGRTLYASGKGATPEYALNAILAGNGLFETLLALAYKEADCYVVSGLTENEKKKLMLADNRIFDLGVDDMAAFESILNDLGDDLDIPGYDSDLLETLVSDPVEVDEAMSSYGIVPEDRKEEIKSNAGIYDNAPVATSPVQETPVATRGNEPREAEHESTRREYVLCPKCGEKIWL